MPEIVYPWKRFWYPPSGQISIADDGFIVDPDSKEAQYLGTEAMSFASIGHMPCLGFLGEPGIGKSTTLEQEFKDLREALEGTDDVALWFDLRDYSSDDRLERKIFEDPEITRWLNGSYTLHLFLDSLDEGLLLVNNISRVLLERLNRLPKERLRLRIASRPRDWPATLEKGLKDLWGGDAVGVFQLAPLRKADVGIAAELSGIDPELLLEAVLRSDVSALANKPVTLDFLIGEFANAKDGTLPKGRAQLYLKGCFRLCEETNRHRREAPLTRGKLSPGQRLAIAARIAAVTQISNRSAVFLGTIQDLGLQDVALDDLIGGTEGRGADQVTVDREAMREVLDTGLFSSRGLGRQGWRHQSYAEFLAAHYLEAHKAPPKTFGAFLLHPDGSGKVVPQLREVAAWFAGINSEVFNFLAQSDPEVLLQSDLAVATDADRTRVARQLLEGFDAGKATRSLWDVQGYLARLKSPALAGIVGQFLTKRTATERARIAAVEICRECRLDDLERDLVAIALDRTDDLRVRVYAASAVEDIGSAAGRRALRPLIFEAASDDINNDLKGCGLGAGWPEHLTAKELFSVLTPPKGENYFGPYRRFLASGIAEQLRSEDVITATEWARKYTESDGDLGSIGRLAFAVLEHSIAYVDQPAVLAAVVATLVTRSRKHLDSSPVAARLKAEGDPARYRVAREMFSVVASEEHGWLTTKTLCSLTSTDVPWLLSELVTAERREVKRLIAEVVSFLVDGSDVETYGAVVATAQREVELRAVLKPRLDAVLLDSSDARDARKNYSYWQRHERPAPPLPDVSATEYVITTLASPTPETFFHIDGWLREHEDRFQNRAQPLPRWGEFDKEIRGALIQCAREYLKTRPPVPDGHWWKTGTFSLGLLAGHSALRLLALESPESLNLLEEDDWSFWARIVVVDLHNASNAAHAVLLRKAYQRAKHIFLSTLRDSIEGEDARYNQVPVVRNLECVWDQEVAKVLEQKIRDGDLTLKAFVDVLGQLLTMNDPYAKEVARTLATGRIPEKGQERRRAVLVTAELLSQDPGEWSLLWPIFQANEQFGVEVLQAAASGREYSSFATKIPENDVAEICLWLSKLGLDRYEPSAGLITDSSVTRLGRWWHTLVNFLSHKGTSESCDAIRRLMQALPQYPGLHTLLAGAEERTRRATWQPFSPEKVIQLSAVDAAVRVVISIHGIQTRGAWQKEINSELQKNGLRHEIYDYCFFTAVKLVIPWFRNREIDRFRRKYEEWIPEGTVPSVIAHSFGTYVVARAIEKYAELRFDRVILCGSIVRRDFPWDSIIKAGRASAVLNEIGMKDIWARLVRSFVRDAGNSGGSGFDLSSSSLIDHRSRPLFGHSDCFYPLNYRENWIPFLKGMDAPVDETK